MKTIKIKDLTEVPAGDVEAGMVLAEGIIVNARAERNGYFYDVAGGDTVWASPDQRVQVYARLDPGMTETLAAAVLDA